MLLVGCVYRLVVSSGREEDSEDSLEHVMKTSVVACSVAVRCC